MYDRSGRRGRVLTVNLEIVSRKELILLLHRVAEIGRVGSEVGWSPAGNLPLIFVLVAACSRCHSTSLDLRQDTVHGESNRLAGPTRQCLHGDHHLM